MQNKRGYFMLVAFIFIVLLLTRNYPFNFPIPGRRLLQRLAYNDERRTDRLVIIYNRVPKTGSTSLMNIAYKLYGINHFNVLYVNASRFATRLSANEQARFALNVSTWHDRMPAIYHGHFSYIDFDSLLGSAKITLKSDAAAAKVLYINVIREPLARLVSYYFFMRFGDDFRPHVVRGRQSSDPVMFDECVRQNGHDCAPERMWLQVPYFCGHYKYCMSPPGNQVALQHAKQNLLTKYFLVGITEELPAFVRCVESALPSIFRGGEQIFKRDSRKRRTKFKQKPSNETLAAFRDHPVYKAEKEFYEYAKLLFHHAQALILNGNFLLENGWLTSTNMLSKLSVDLRLDTPKSVSFDGAASNPDVYSPSLFFPSRGKQFIFQKIKPR